MKSMAIAYANKRKKMAKGGSVAAAEDAPDIKGVNKQTGTAGMSRAGMDLRAGAVDSAKSKHRRMLSQMQSMDKPKLYADGGDAESNYDENGNLKKNVAPENDVPGSSAGSAAQSSSKKPGSTGADPDTAHAINTFVNSHMQAQAHGGMIGEGLVDRIMAKRSNMMSKGGMVANDTMPEADGMPAEFDYLVTNDDLTSTYGDDNNSGDESGNAQEAADRADIIARVLASRKKRDKMPRPA